jgi:hypothetical protein
MGKMVATELKLTFKSQGAKPELRNLCEQLKANLNKPHFVHAKKDEILSGLEILLGVSGSSSEWNCLNSGTHESDRPEFDRATVTRIVDALVVLDRTLS